MSLRLRGRTTLTIDDGLADVPLEAALAFFDAKHLRKFVSESQVQRLQGTSPS
jgi:hypothetical protein